MKTRLQDHIENLEYLKPDVVHKRNKNDSELLDSVIKDLRDREQRGKLKYNTTMDRDDLTLLEWEQHKYEELLDAALYTKKIITEIKKSYKLLNKNEEAY